MNAMSLAKANGKLIISGEHSVVYGQPALATQLNRSTICSINTRHDALINIQLKTLNLNFNETQADLIDFFQQSEVRYAEFLNNQLLIANVLPEPEDYARFCIGAVLSKLALDTGLSIAIDSDIPVGCGLGSSAALAHAIFAAFQKHFQLDDDVFEQVSWSEHRQHGHSSGVDAWVTCHAGAVEFSKDTRPKAMTFPKMDWYWLNTGQPQQTTGEVVAWVKEHHAQSGVWNQFGEVTQAIKSAWRNTDEEKLHLAIRDNHQLLCDIGVTPPKIQSMIKILESQGHSAKISGAGALSGDSAGVVLLLKHPQVDLSPEWTKL